MKYYGVIGNRDYIKLRGERLPFWEFLDRQPNGWLSSLIYKRKDLPKRKPMIWDCGAWSYRNEEVPKITPESCLEEYKQHAPKGSIVIAPDHMLINGVNQEARRKFNRGSAKEFLSICPKRFKPMACIHGNDLDERVKAAEYLLGLGYEYLAIGGIAARASQKQTCFGIVRRLRELTEGHWLHVLGLSSPHYFAMWQKLGVDSCDGSSHFKQAFTGGAFFTREGARLKKHQAAREGEPVTAPECSCKACELLREDGVDTRRYGSNETNMGRAAHNLNQLMAAHRYVKKHPDAFDDGQKTLDL